MPKPTTIDLYDFDHTIYDGDASIDFYLFCLRRNPALIRYLPAQAWHAVWYLLRLENRTTFKGHYFAFLRGVTDTPASVDKFWDSHFKKIKSWYLLGDHRHDVLISASPSFLLEPIRKELQAYKLIATELDTKTGKLLGENCRGEEKARRLQLELPGVVIGKAYSDSMSDLPILKLAKEAFMVKGETVTELKTKD